ncbi:MAG: metal ABC transporter ATP-binding protein [Treponema sp.]|jgi:zinc transport system ATP-binding protein|nr:metal ABC transporter ATP-binding protein [Treponema sp.]
MSDINALHHYPADKEIAVKFDAVSFSYGDTPVLENASFHIHMGEFIAMVGPNGSGKTTVLKLLFGLETPSAGTIEIFGSGGRKQRENNFAYVPQQPPADNMFPITVRDIVRMGLLRPFKRYPHENASGAQDVAEAMERTGIADLASRSYRSLSGGQRRRALVARALAAKPDLLVLDEPTANMDSESEDRLYETLGAYKGKTTILIVTHDTEFVSSLTDRVLCLGDGSRAIVQHRVEPDAPASVHHGGFGHEASASVARVLHGENISADDCCEK